MVWVFFLMQKRASPFSNILAAKMRAVGVFVDLGRRTFPKSNVFQTAILFFGYSLDKADAERERERKKKRKRERERERERESCIVLPQLSWSCYF